MVLRSSKCGRSYERGTGNTVYRRGDISTARAGGSSQGVDEFAAQRERKFTLRSSILPERGENS
jgi:hypothetical protein